MGKLKRRLMRDQSCGVSISNCAFGVGTMVTLPAFKYLLITGLAPTSPRSESSSLNMSLGNMAGTVNRAPELFATPGFSRLICHWLQTILLGFFCDASISRNTSLSTRHGKSANENKT